MPGPDHCGHPAGGRENALLLLDEIDQEGTDYRGDPSSALLEVLDSMQNGTFRDHFLEIPFDLSHCFFITTANTTDTIPRPLLDRMEVIELSSYTDEEKLHIAKEHLLPKQIEKHGMTRAQLRLTDDAIREIITCYTRESGVRNLERSLAAVCRKAAMQFAETPELKRVSVTGTNLEQFLGVRKFLPDTIPASDQVGIVTGLAWTAVGGETLEVEVNVVDGSGKLELTGNLGDVMKESALAAMSYIRSHAQQLHIPTVSTRPRTSMCTSRRGGAEGWTVCRRHHLHSHGFGALRRPGTPGHCHDRRNLHPRSGAGHWRTEGKNHGGSAPRRAHRHHPGGK